MSTITLKLKGLFQSYGSDSTFYQRKSDDYPTKSAVIGILAACLGYRRTETDKIKELNSLQFAVRVDQPGVITTDFQNAHIDGHMGANNVTRRQYIQDGVFLVAVSSDNSELIDEIMDALAHPYFYPTLGRRSALPAGPLEYKRYNTDILSVLKQVQWQAADWYQANNYLDRLDVFGDNDIIESNDRPFVIHDNVVSFDSKRREFRPRLVNKMFVANPTKNTIEVEDAWSVI